MLSGKGPQSGNLYDVAKALGVTHRTAELHYAPFDPRLQRRVNELVAYMPIPGRKAGEVQVHEAAANPGAGRKIETHILRLDETEESDVNEAHDS